MKSILVFVTVLMAIVQGRPEPPSRFRSAAQHDQYLPPSSYGAPPTDNFAAPLPAKQTLITKNVYVHLPPQEYPEHEVEKQEVEQVRKHYKIVFIKAPTPPTPKPVKLPQQDEHKTLVYVLVKKPDAERHIETPSTTEASRPEVFFIKYKETKPSNSYGPPPN